MLLIKKQKAVHQWIQTPDSSEAIQFIMKQNVANDSNLGMLYNNNSRVPVLFKRKKSLTP
jgi:antitoxin component HigA of HigAB toxin-antitoxin module